MKSFSDVHKSRWDIHHMGEKGLEVMAVSNNPERSGLIEGLIRHFIQHIKKSLDLQ